MEDKIILVNEDGEEVEFFIDEQFEFEDNLYVVCMKGRGRRRAFVPRRRR
jgi:hypothetical protein